MSPPVITSSRSVAEDTKRRNVVALTPVEKVSWKSTPCFMRCPPMVVRAFLVPSDFSV